MIAKIRKTILLGLIAPIGWRRQNGLCLSESQRKMEAFGFLNFWRINMEKKEIGETKLIILAFCGILCLVVGFALKFQAKKANVEIAVAEEDTEQAVPEYEMGDLGEYLTENMISSSVSGNGRMTEFDENLIPTYPDGIYMGNNELWEAYYSSGRNCAAFVSESNLSRNYNINFFEVNGCIYTLPLNVATFPWDKSLMDYCNFSDYTESFNGEGYGNVDSDLQMIWGNMIYLQCYPGSELVNAVHIDAERMLISDEGMSASIAGIEIGMSEEEVIFLLGAGTKSCTLYAMDEYINIAVESAFDRTFYKNGTGILVVSYNENRIVEALSLYSDAISHE